MPFGTASNRLKKKILFNLLVKHLENVCYKCGATIETEEELSVEHKNPWLHVSAELFWDLENIAFSHLICNRPDRPNGNRFKKRIFPPSGTSWCSRHKNFLPENQFTKDKYTSNGFSKICKACNHYWRVAKR